MFKKPVKVSAQNQLSGKDKKVIKSKASESLDNECVDKILSSNEKIICCKIQGSKMLIYNGE
jgi:translation initiation factor 2D